MVGTFALGDNLEALMRVLKNLPSAKPTDAALRTQLTGPAIVGVKAVYDFVAAVVDMAAHGFSLKQVTLLGLSIVFMAAALWAWDTLKRNHEAALTAKSDPHYEWAVTYVKRLIDAQARDEEGEP